MFSYSGSEFTLRSKLKFEPKQRLCIFTCVLDAELLRFQQESLIWSRLINSFSFSYNYCGEKDLILMINFCIIAALFFPKNSFANEITFKSLPLMCDHDSSVSFSLEVFLEATDCNQNDLRSQMFVGIN